MAKQTALKLEVACVPTTQRTYGPNGRTKALTRIFIRMDGKVIAERVIPGKWTTGAALIEFRRFPDRFSPRGNSTSASLHTAARYAA